MGQSAAPAEPRRVVVIGCIKPAAAGRAGSNSAELTITDYRGGGPPAPTFRLDANDTKLMPWVSDTVEIHGTVAAGSASAGADATFKLTVEKVFVISRGCKPAQVQSN
jgi:hypothetical protein